ncbi:hypothetical protein BTUL_0042g00830 [Botrytis tulipae]|uniref:Ubiquitin-like domain-containing protein n=1 Tax=Botrytis tulipae TaxID=87230 RepID=A0A4Z1EWN3_9HELO|nr:hypothetical protein BTUL_0042g00830 [Botrytis tulipae]
MSFGWSAGDIAQATSLIVKVVKALDDASGAPDEYRKMAVFLENVNLTLKNLHVFATLGVYPSYGDEIRRQIENIRPPLERFIKIMKNFEPHLGSNATPGWWKNIPRKMLWTFKHSHHKLKKEIKGYLLALDSLLNRFTLEVVFTLPDELKQLFINTLTPQMISALEAMVNPVRSEISLMRNEGRRQQKELHSKTEEIILLLQSLKMDDSKSENNGALDAAVHKIKEHITSTLRSTSNNPQIPIIDSCSRGACNADSLPATNVLFQAMNKDPLEASDEEIKQSLRNIYYGIILYAGMFLRNLCLYLANRLKLSRPMVPSLLAIYHITFHDALGRPPRVLQFDVFNNFQVFQAFLYQSFSDTVAKPWVERGSYILANKSEKSALTADTWPRIIKPGCHIEMAMLLDYSNRREDRCPDTSCSGVLIKKPNSTWTKCSSCQKDVIEPGVAKKIEKSYAPLSQVAMERHETEGSQAVNTATFARESFGELIVDEAEAGLQGVNKVHVRGLWGKEEGRVKKCLGWLMETPRSDGSKSPVGGFDFGNHSSRHRREVARPEPQLAREGIELRDFGIHDQNPQTAPSGPALPSLESLSNVPANLSKPQNHPNDTSPRNPVQQRATSHQRTPSPTQRTPAPPPQKPRNHRAPTPNPTINTFHDRLTVHHSSPPNPSQPVSYTSEESRDVTSQTRLASHNLPLSLQINPGSITSIARSRPSRITRPLTQST